MSEASKILDEMNDRSREVFRLIVESYLDSGEPVGSRTLDPHIVGKGQRRHRTQCNAGSGVSGSSRQPACQRRPNARRSMGLRMFVDGLLEVGDLGADDRQKAGTDTRL